MISEPAFFERLVAVHPELRAMRDAHIAEYAELLGHVFIADVQKWLLERLSNDRATVVRVLDVLEESVGSEDDPVTNLISVSFLEGLGRSPARTAEVALRAALPARLSRALQALESWRPL